MSLEARCRALAQAVEALGGDIGPMLDLAAFMPEGGGAAAARRAELAHAAATAAASKQW